MAWQKDAKIFSNQLTNFLKGSHKRKIIVTDKHNNRLFHLPLSFFIIATLFLPILVGILLFLFLISEYHALIEKEEEILQ